MARLIIRTNELTAAACSGIDIWQLSKCEYMAVKAKSSASFSPFALVRKKQDLLSVFVCASCVNEIILILKDILSLIS
jgi:hypothetical protein